MLKAVFKISFLKYKTLISFIALKIVFSFQKLELINVALIEFFYRNYIVLKQNIDGTLYSKLYFITVRSRVTLLVAYKI